MDPFELLKENLNSGIGLMTAKLDQWRALKQKWDSAAYEEVNSELQRHLADFRRKLDKGNQVLNMIKANRTKFSNISDKEIMRREEFLREMGAFEHSVKSTLDSSKGTSNTSTYRRKVQENLKKKSLEFDDAVSSKRLDNTAIPILESVQIVKNDQDLILDDMATVLKSINLMSKEMETELQDQKRLLEQANNKSDEVNSQSQLVIGKLKQILGTDDTGKICVVVVLAIILIVLIAIVFYF